MFCEEPMIFENEPQPDGAESVVRIVGIGSTVHVNLMSNMRITPYINGMFQHISMPISSRFPRSIRTWILSHPCTMSSLPIPLTDSQFG